MSSVLGFLVFGAMLSCVVYFFVLLFRQDEQRRHRPHPGPEEGGDSFGDTTHWGGMGRPGT